MKMYIETNVGLIHAKKLGTGFTRKGEVATWFKVDDYFVALDSRNHWLESSTTDPRDDYDFIPA